MKKLMSAMIAAVLAGVANAEICIKKGDASLPPIRLNVAKIPGCSKAHVCNDLQYGGRQLGKGTKDANSAQTYDLYLPGNVGEINREAPFFLFVHGMPCPLHRNSIRFR